MKFRLKVSILTVYVTDPYKNYERLLFPKSLCEIVDTYLDLIKSKRKRTHT